MLLILCLPISLLIPAPQGLCQNRHVDSNSN